MLSQKYYHLDIKFVDMNNKKIDYVLTQHSLYACKYHLFILCRYGRGESNIVCKSLTDNEYAKLQRKSEKKMIKH